MYLRRVVARGVGRAVEVPRVVERAPRGVDRFVEVPQRSRRHRVALITPSKLHESSRVYRVAWIAPSKLHESSRRHRVASVTAPCHQYARNVEDSIDCPVAVAKGCRSRHPPRGIKPRELSRTSIDTSRIITNVNRYVANYHERSFATYRATNDHSRRIEPRSIICDVSIDAGDGS
jgi:hypothetical protein